MEIITALLAISFIANTVTLWALYKIYKTHTQCTCSSSSPESSAGY